MVYPILGQILIISIILINCLRIFFLKFGKIDSLTVLAPLSVLLCIFQIIAWKVDFFSIILLGIAIFDFFINFRALLRFASGLYVDHYSIGFKIGAIFTIVISFFYLITLIFFFPISIFDNKFNSECETVRVFGSFRSGFRKSHFFEKSSGEINFFTSPKKSNGVVLFFPDKRADTERYIPFLKSLSEKGYTVVSADLYANDIKWFYSVKDFKIFRRFFMIQSSIFNPALFESQREFYLYNSMQECKAVYDYAKNIFPEETQYFMIGDEMTFPGIKEFSKENKNILKILNISDFVESSTSSARGYGFVQNLDLLLADYLKLDRELNFQNVRTCAQKIDFEIRENSQNLVFENEENLSLQGEK